MSHVKALKSAFFIFKEFIMKLVYEVEDIKEALNDFAEKNGITHNVEIKETGSNEFSISIKESKKTAEVKKEPTPATEQKDTKPVTEEAPKAKNIFGQPTSVSNILG